jgi:hypothetical protein
MMHIIKVETDQIKLPIEIADKLIGKEIQLIEIQDGFMIKTLSDPIKKARGILKNKNFSTQRYFQLKAEDKDIEK